MHARIFAGAAPGFAQGYIDAAHISWAHIGLAQLVKHGYVVRILTTNFAPLITRAFNTKPDMLEIANNWGFTILSECQAVKRNKPAAADALLASAEKVLRQAEAIEPGRAAYNLACMEALRCNVAESLQWLACGHTHGELPGADYIRADKDFDDIRDTPEFAAWWRETFGPDEPLKYHG